MHNDVAYDSTAVWTHLAARTRGAQDRVGRMIPVLVFGVILLGIGVPLTAWGYGDPEIVPALLGVCLALLLGGLGVSSVALGPLPLSGAAARATRRPAAAGRGRPGGVAQGFSVFGILLVATPAIVVGSADLVRGRRLVELDRAAHRGGGGYSSSCSASGRRGLAFRPSRPGTAGLRHATLGP